MLKRYGYAWITLGFFAVSIVLHWSFGWFAYVDEAKEHHQVAELSPWLIQMSRDTFENWQSEFLQLFAMVVLTTFLIHKGSSESRDGDEEMRIAILRIEERLIDMDERSGAK